MKITTIFNQELEIKDCLGCYLVKTGVFNDGVIAQTDTMQLALDLELAYPGMMILSPKRHVEYFDDLTAGELKDWNKLLAIATKALRQDPTCKRIAYFFRSFAGYHIHLAIMPIWENGAYRNDQSILIDLIANCEKLRKENAKEVLLYRDELRTKINAYLNNKK